MPVDCQKLEAAVRAVLRGEGIKTAEISLAVVDDPTIHELNRQYLGHDYATDVLSFVLERNDQALEGEVIVSSETAERQAESYGWSADKELLLYVVHGTLHLVGYDDATDSERSEMRRLEQRYLSEIGIRPLAW